MSHDISQCPDCGWTGTAAEFEVDGQERKCPACQCVLKQV